MDYRVTWEIDVEADSPIEAAKKAQEIQWDLSSTATVFTVECGEKPHAKMVIDLAEKEPPVFVLERDDTWEETLRFYTCQACGDVSELPAYIPGYVIKCKHCSAKTTMK